MIQSHARRASAVVVARGRRETSVLVDLRVANSGLMDLGGWDSLTRASDLRHHKLDGIEVDFDGNVTAIVLNNQGLRGKSLICGFAASMARSVQLL